MSKLLVLLILFITGCQPQIDNRASSGTTVVCFGDSLTAGYGSTAGNDYPSLLSKKISLPVINAGVTGDTTRDALLRLDHDVLAHDPKLVIITLGANDFFQGTPKKETLANMTTIIERIKKQGSMVVWAEVKMGILGDPYIDDFTALADREHIELIPDILSGIIDNPLFKYDQIHPNDIGYKMMAERIYQKIKGLI
jgi:lysophospholipase L1-like esterase